MSYCDRRGGLMVSVLYTGESGPGSSLGWGHCVVFSGKTLDGLASHPGGSRNILSRFMLQKPG